MFLVEDPQELRIERAAIAKHRKKDASEFVSGGGDGRRGTESCAKTAKVVTPVQSGCDKKWSQPYAIATSMLSVLARSIILCDHFPWLAPPFFRRHHSSVRACVSSSPSTSAADSVALMVELTL